ncbi:hypothetical protein MUG84_26625 [Paenibacillus sp. KQZ6P-2]|uniref:Uncharacterized protein n=1 Tax=Paenibacillus mangrovi TaxID=2931978 RepID=A0A9X1WUI8_9BACL|nr:hypothetical protein [Paenibacillus mangrovi]MCJ8015248.1 hypothetical protein [Paenibacillus mangrovi]
MDVFTKRDLYRRMLRKQLRLLYAQHIDASKDKDLVHVNEIEQRISFLYVKLLSCDPGEIPEKFGFDSGNKKRPRLPA